MKKISLILVVLMLALTGGCTESNTEKDISGTWTGTLFLSHSDCEKYYGEFPQDISVQMGMDWVDRYHKDGTGSSMGTIHLQLTIDKETIPLKFYVSSKGTWKVSENTLIETAKSIEAMAANQTTRDVLKKTPGLMKKIEDMAGVTCKSKIVSLTESRMSLVDKETGMPCTMFR